MSTVNMAVLKSHTIAVALTVVVLKRGGGPWVIRFLVPNGKSMYIRSLCIFPPLSGRV